jgi:hypothetical protein
MYDDKYSVEAPRSRARRIGTLMALWALLVAGVLLWQAWHYTGLFARFAEWQFAHFERMFPAASIAGITTLLSSPLIFLLWRETRRHRRRYGRPTRTARLMRETTITRFLGLMTVATALTFAVLLWRAYATGEPSKTQLDALPFTAGATVQEAQLDTNAWVLTHRLGNYEQRALFSKTYTMLAPVTETIDATNMKFFLVTDAKLPAPATQQRVQGYVREVKLPGGFERLFTNGGYRIDRPTYLIYPNAESALRPRLGLAETVMRFGVLMLLAFLIHRIHYRRVRRRYKESLNPEV